MDGHNGYQEVGDIEMPICWHRWCGGGEWAVMLHGAVGLHYGGFIGMPVFRSSGMSFVTLAEVDADGTAVIPKT